MTQSMPKAISPDDTPAAVEAAPMTAPMTAPVAAPLDAATVAEHDAAEYIEAMCTELLSLADRAGLGFLGYLLEVAREEAMLHISRSGVVSAQVMDPLTVYGEVPPTRP